MEEDSVSLSTHLLCRETESSEEDEYVQLLLNTDTNFGNQSRECSHILIDQWIKRARLDAISWILKTRASFGFRFQTAYLSVTYLDRFLSRRTIDSEKCWAIRLLSVACLSLAVKMEEYKVPALSEYHRMEEYYNFESRVVLRMELLVLNTLEWKMSSVTPFAYVHYFARKFYKDGSPPLNVVSKSVELILAMMKDENVMVHRPSVVAGVATLVALDPSLTRQALEIKINAFSPSGFLEIEEVFSCYNQMQALAMEKVTTLPKCQTTPILSPLRRIDVFETSSVTSLSTKRKSLSFHNYDQMPNEKRRR